jgi:hypothetical protein
MYAPTAPRRIANWVSEELDRRVGLYLAAFSAVFLILSCMQAATKLMWFDELDTFYHASLPGPGAIYDALKLGADANPPLYPLLTSYFFELWGRSELSVRLGAVLGFWVMTLCLFSFVRRRTGALFGFLAVGFILVSFVYEYAYEGRAYGALFGFTGATLLCWQRAGEGGRRRALWTAGLALALAGAISSHYFGILIWIPIGAGELARSFVRRRIDVAVWIALLAGLTPIAFYLPLMRATRAAVVKDYWNPPRLSMILDTYRTMLKLSTAPVLGALGLWAIMETALPADSSPATPERRGVPVGEFIAVAALAALPVFGVVGGMLVGGYAERYTFSSMLGLAALFAFLAFELSRGSALLGVVFLIVFFGWFGMKSVSNVKVFQSERGARIGKPAAPLEHRNWVRYARASDLPLVLTNGVYFLQIHYYAPEDISRRAVYLADQDLARRYAGANTADKILLVLRTLARQPVEDYHSFVAAHPHFLMCVNLEQTTWLFSMLVEDRTRMVLKARDDLELLFEVDTGSAPDAP